MPNLSQTSINKEPFIHFSLEKCMCDWPVVLDPVARSVPWTVIQSRAWERELCWFIWVPKVILFLRAVAKILTKIKNNKHQCDDLFLKWAVIHNLIGMNFLKNTVCHLLDVLKALNLDDPEARHMQLSRSVRVDLYVQFLSVLAQ